tara:strand:- start:2526 stop:3737 length:1212 start_codon:yes stop_codon:yes gene_type:complete
MTSNKKAISNSINKLQDVYKNLSNNGKVKDLTNKLIKDKQKLNLFFKKHPIKIIVSIFTIIAILIYLIIFYRRICRYLNRMNKYYDPLINVNPIQYNKKIMNGDFKLCDFYIASSYKSYLPCTNYYDYSCAASVKRVLKYGARYIDIDIMNNDFNYCTEPVVAYGEQKGNWKYTTSVHFSEIIEVISTYAFSSYIKNGSDPLFLNINFNTWYNKKTINKCAEMIKNKLSHKLLNKNFSYQGRYTSTNIATTSIKKLLNKLIIISNSNVKNTLMDELVNINPFIGGNMRNMKHTDIENLYDSRELMIFNRKNLSVVSPNFNKRSKENYNFYTSYYLGCQFILMNYTEPTDWMVAYIKRFAHCSFILKPYKLRYRAVYIKKPLKQTVKVSFAPKKETTPFYSMTY